MANLTTYSENEINDLLFGSVALTEPPTYYVGVSTTEISEDGSGKTEPSGGNYARVAIANNKTTFSASALGVIDNSIDIIFPESSASWGTIGHWFIADAATNGNIWYRGTLAATRSVESLTTLVIPIGGLTITTK